MATEEKEFKETKVAAIPLMEFLTVFLLAFVILVPGIFTHDIGWDEPVYVSAGRAYIEALASEDFYGSVWQWNHEHPPLAKYLYGISSLSLTSSLGDPYYGARVATSLMSSLTVAVCYLFSKRAFGRAVGILSAAVLISIPFYYGMSRYVSLDMPIAFLVSVYIWLFYLGIEMKKPLLIFFSSVFFGLAGAAKVSGFTAFLVLVLWLILRFGSKTFQTINQYRKENLRMFLALLFYLIVGAIIFVSIWPWLWPSLFDRLFGSDGVLTYASRFQSAGHEEFFEGQVIWHPPWYYYLYYLSVKIPIPTLLFFVIGVAQIVKTERRNQSGKAFLLTLLWLMVPLAVQTYQQPYDVLRPILLIFPPLAILSALGAYQTISWVNSALGLSRVVDGHDRKNQRTLTSSMATLFVIAILIVPSVVAVLQVGPLEIAYFNEFAGSSETILHTFESSFWAEGLGEAVDYINNIASHGASICVIGEQVAFNEFHRGDLNIVGYVQPESLVSSNVEYVVFQGFYLQHFVWQNRTAWGSPSSALDLWNYLQNNGELVRIIKAGNAPLVWIFKVKDSQ